MRYLALFLMLVSLCAFTVGCAGEKPATPAPETPAVEAGDAAGEEAAEEAADEEPAAEPAAADAAEPAAPAQQ